VAIDDRQMESAGIGTSYSAAPVLSAIGAAVVAWGLSTGAWAQAPAAKPVSIQVASSDALAAESKPERLGGCGAYVPIDGSAKIVRVEQTQESSAQAASSGGPGYAGYEVWFSFTPSEPVSNAELAAWIAKEHELRLANSWYPGPEFLKKYDLEAGKTVPVTLDVQMSGPCTPFVFKFPTVDTTDYFESGS
jgi:hypothetical protein